MADRGQGGEQADGVIMLPEVLLEEFQRIHGYLPEGSENLKACSPEKDANCLTDTFRVLHRQERWALCLSGGGIRSATFALGVVQGLARNGLLERFDYLSTVSGGGYLGGWLSGWIQRHKDGLSGVAS